MRCSPFAAAAAVLCLVLSACTTASPPPAAPPAPSASAAPLPVALPDSGWARFRSKRFEVSIAFPEGKSWRIDDHTSPWLTARHPSSDSVVYGRVWHEANIVNRADCERRAHEWLKELPLASELEVIDDRRLEGVPAGGFDTWLRAGVIAPKTNAPDAVLTTSVMAFGASMKKCFAAAYISRSVGAASSARAGESLAIGTRIVESAILRSELTPPTRLAP